MKHLRLVLLLLAVVGSVACSDLTTAPTLEAPTEESKEQAPQLGSGG